MYSYQFLSCVECHDHSYKNWLKYIAIAFGPLTVFFIIVITCRISATSAKLNQILVFPAHMIMIAILANNPTTALEQVVAHTVFSLYGIWNLDFFRTFYEPFCLHPDMLCPLFRCLPWITLYPLVLIVITSTLAELHDRNIRIVQRVLMFATKRKIRTDSVELLPHRIDHAEEYATLELPSEATYGSIGSTPAV